jgi:DNA-binding CsgD family transcriptional regulator
VYIVKELTPAPFTPESLALVDQDALLKVLISLHPEPCWLMDRWGSPHLWNEAAVQTAVPATELLAIWRELCTGQPVPQWSLSWLADDAGGRIGLLAWHGSAAAHPEGWLDLTERERQVAMLLLQGKRGAQVAAQLGCAAKTVEQHAGHIYSKLNVSNRREFMGLCSTYSLGDER